MEKYFQFFGNRNAHTVLCIYLFFFLTSATAQNISNETNVFIPAGIEVSTSGGLVNAGFIQNNGSFTMKGDWSNQNVYQGTGIVVLAGDNQIIYNNSQAIEQLVIDGGGIKTLEGKLTVSARIVFNNGVLLVNDDDTLCMGKNSIVNGGSNLSYVNGALMTQGNGYKFFPVGKSGKYHPVELVDIEGLDPIVEVEVFENLPVIQTTIPTTLFRDIYWTRKTISGTFDRSPITLVYDIPETTDLTRLVIAEANDFTSEFSLLDNVTVESGSSFDFVSTPRTLSGNIFVLGELIDPPPLPYYLSTTLSSRAGNSDNRAIKVFGDNNVVDFNFQVFNRWGLLIFESKSYSSMAAEGWDGRQNGIVLPSGVYPYSLKYIDGTGKLTQAKGFITIIQ